MEPQEAGDTIREAAEERTIARDEDALRREEKIQRLRQRGAIIIGILAALLAITALGGDQARESVINSNILSADTYNFYQAKYIRQTVYQISANDLQALLQTNPTMPAKARATIAANISRYKATAARYEDDPAGGTGKKQLLEQARRYDEKRDQGERQLPSFNDAQALFQIAIVLGSVGIASSSRSVLLGGSALGVVAFLLMLNAYLFHLVLPGS